MTEEVPMPEKRQICDIAAEIRRDWKNPYFGARPYIQAMAAMTDVDTPYGSDDARSIIRYFLNNAKTWKGETARRVKAELKKLVGD
jgi:hypothetical protein